MKKKKTSSYRITTKEDGEFEVECDYIGKDHLTYEFRLEEELIEMISVHDVRRISKINKK